MVMVEEMEVVEQIDVEMVDLEEVMEVVVELVKEWRW